jgi:phosphatidylserine/phosphatidylglycerophosphate/cardiolipin synthase-like enzyme
MSSRPPSLPALLPTLLILLLGTASLHCAGCPSRPDDPLVPVDPSTVQMANDRDFLVAAREAIDAATDRVHVIEYVIYDSGPVHDLLQAMVDAADRGVEVKVLADEESGDTEQALAFLADGGVDVSLDSPDTTTHNKLIVADDVTLVGSHNFSTSALSYNHEASLRVESPAVTAYYEAYFQALWEDPQPEPVLDPPGTDPVVPLVDREIAGALAACVANATDRVRVVMYAISYRDDYPDSEVNLLVEDLVASHGRQVDVAVVLDRSDWIDDNGINDRAAEVLLAGGVPLHSAPSSQTTHAKVLVCDDTVIVGDANWSYSAFDLYHGTSLQVTDAGLADGYVQWFDELWEGGNGW